MNGRLFMTLVCMSFLWIGSQIPLYLFGSVLPLIYQDVGGVDRYTWFVIGYLIPNAALCPFVGALSDLFGRRNVAIVGQVCLIVGPIITATANTMNIAIGKHTHSCSSQAADHFKLETYSLASAPASTNSSHSLERAKLFLLRTVANMSAWWSLLSFLSAHPCSMLR
jgi:MFS family permease